MNLQLNSEATHLPMNLESSAADKWNTRLGSDEGRNPFGVVDLFPTIPRVARSHVERGKPRNPGLRGAIPLGLGQFGSVSQGICGRFMVAVPEISFRGNLTPALTVEKLAMPGLTELTD